MGKVGLISVGRALEETISAQNKRSSLYLATAARRRGEVEESYNGEMVRGGKRAKYGRFGQRTTGQTEDGTLGRDGKRNTFYASLPSLSIARDSRNR